MKFSVNPPKGWKQWGVWVITFKFALDFGRWLFNNRGSSNESKKEFIRTNQKIKEIKEAMLTKEDFRKIIREENKDFITKDLMDSKLEAFEERIESKIALKFKDMEIIHKESILREDNAKKLWENSRTEHHKSKHRIDEVYGKLVERLNGKK